MKEDKSQDKDAGKSGGFVPQGSPDNMPSYQETVKDLNAKILKITSVIRDQYPELVKYLDEMNDTLPNDEHPDQALEDLKKYYESLVTMVNRYKLEHHYKSKDE